MAVKAEMTSWPPPRWGAHLPDGVLPGDVDLAQGHTLAGAWAAAWARDPRREVLRTLDGIRMSAGELAERSALAAGRYAAAGLRPGDPVLMSAPPSLDLIVSYVGAIRYGLTVVPANTAYTAAELAHLVEDAGPLVAVVDDPRRLDGTYLSCATPDLTGLPPARDGIPLDLATPDDIALIVYTSGTTGKPKGALLTHANLLASAHAIRLAWRWTPDDRLVLCLPLFHVHGLGVGLHGSLVAGGSAVVLPGFDAAAIGTAIREHEASMFFGVPTMYHRLAGSPHLSELARLRLAVSGSAPLAAELHAAIGAGSGQQVLERYGMSETMMLVSNPYDGERRPGTVGFPLPGVDLRLAEREGGTAEIEVRGPNVCSGYLGRPDANEAAYTDDGWFRTGDLGEFDAAGYLRISGRAKELIITGGYNVYPREVEEVLSQHPAVADCVVAGVPSGEWGETVAAFVVPRQAGGDQAELEALEKWCAERLAPFKRPRLWRFIESVPRNAMGKALRHELHP